MISIKSKTGRAIIAGVCGLAVLALSSCASQAQPAPEPAPPPAPQEDAPPPPEGELPPPPPPADEFAPDMDY